MKSLGWYWGEGPEAERPDTEVFGASGRRGPPLVFPPHPPHPDPASRASQPGMWALCRTGQPSQSVKPCDSTAL